MPKRKRVYIVGAGNEDSAYIKMFKDKGWGPAESIRKAHLVQFIGGEDVSPSFYGEDMHPKTHSNPLRDIREAIIFQVARSLKIPMAGICRGAQFLNVMCGGKLFQHVNRHATGELHEVLDLSTNEEFKATSTHHQLMISADEGTLIAVAYETTQREKMRGGHAVATFTPAQNIGGDPEVILYGRDRVLCFQPHPEFAGVPQLAEIYFYYLKKYLGLVNKRK